MVRKILLIGQTPPPYGGQAMMIERTIKGNYGDNIQIFHIRMNFSQKMSNVGKFELRKIFHLFKIIILAYYHRIYNRTEILYYFPAGPKTIPVCRDILILGFIRPIFKKIIFHFRAAGLSNYITKKNIFYKTLLKLIYSKPDICIRLSEYTPEDDKFLEAKKSFIVYNGIEDYAKIYSNKLTISNKIQLLYIGVMMKTKGIFDIIESLKYLQEQNIVLNLVGEFESENLRKQLYQYINENDLNSKVNFLGLLTGSDKYNALLNCDIFIYPSYFESEGLPGAIIEAMCFSKPIVATRWRGIPSLVYDNENGFLVPIKSPTVLAEKVNLLIDDENLRKKFGEKSREIYLKKFTIDNFYKNMKIVFESI